MNDGCLFAVGIGAGAEGQMTGDCRAALASADLIVGFSSYIKLVRPFFPDKDYIDTPMTTEEERCRRALELAASGKRVCVVCSGDAGIYGMASLLYELSPKFPGVTIEVVPGVTAACSGAAMLGAPLSHDFAVISLSDLLTPWELIEKRLTAVGIGDFAVCLYNPGSHKRRDHLMRACDILLAHKPPETVCGLARNIGREGAETRILTLAELRDTRVDMFTTVFIGNSQTMDLGGKVITPRGYKNV